MSDLVKYINKRKEIDKTFAKDFDDGYDKFKIGMILKEARETSGLTQEQLAFKIHTNKTAISRIENHANDIKLSTLEKVAKALGKKLKVTLS